MRLDRLTNKFQLALALPMPNHLHSGTTTNSSNHFI